MSRSDIIIERIAFAIVAVFGLVAVWLVCTEPFA